MSDTIDQAMNQALAQGIFPAASLWVASGRQTLHQGHYGKAKKTTLFDIASLTKPVATATLAMQFVQEGLLKLDDTIYQWLGGARLPVHRKITLRHLLNHTSGFPSWQPYYRDLPMQQIGTAEGKQHILTSCLQEPTLSEPGDRSLYSDLGYIILGEILEQAGLASLDKLFQKKIANHLGLKNTFFVRNLEPRTGDLEQFAPTEDCPWRRKLIQGEVHDQNAYAMGGVAGHAGLFSTTEDLQTFIAEFLKCHRGESNWISKDVIRQFIDSESRRTKNEERRTPSTYVLGWDTPTPGSSSAGRYFSPNSVGHLGYTGCSMWIDLDMDFWIILLTNRIHPSTTNEKIKAFRPRIHNLIRQEFKN